MSHRTYTCSPEPPLKVALFCVKIKKEEVICMKCTCGHVITHDPLKGYHCQKCLKTYTYHELASQIEPKGSEYHTEYDQKRKVFVIKKNKTPKK